VSLPFQLVSTSLWSRAKLAGNNFFYGVEDVNEIASADHEVSREKVAMRNLETKLRTKRISSVIDIDDSRTISIQEIKDYMDDFMVFNYIELSQTLENIRDDTGQIANDAFEQWLFTKHRYRVTLLALMKEPIFWASVVNLIRSVNLITEMIRHPNDASYHKCINLAGFILVAFIFFLEPLKNVRKDVRYQTFVADNIKHAFKNPRSKFKSLSSRNLQMCEDPKRIPKTLELDIRLKRKDPQDPLRDVKGDPS